MSFVHRFARQALFPVTGCAASTLLLYSATREKTLAHCEELPTSSNASTSPSSGPPPVAGFQPQAKGDFHGIFPLRQLFQPKKAYPWWDDDWDGKKPPSTGNPDADRERYRDIRKNGVTRHIILVRHGQYDESPKDDSKRILTELGRQQAEYTGKRIAELMEGAVNNGDADSSSKKQSTPCNVKVVRVSNMTRAKETADIIASQLSKVERSDPDPLLDEGKPCHNVPGGRAGESSVAKTDDHHPRIEEAFQKYFYRHDTEVSSEEPRHEFEVIVCHANVIRYFACRALQLPPEAWLRLCTFNCSLTYLTIRPTGSVSIRSLGDTGHLPYSHITFSGHHGYNW